MNTIRPQSEPQVISFQNKKRSRLAVLELTQQLCLLLRSGESIDQALSFLLENTRDDTTQQLLIEVRNDVRMGRPLSQAMTSQPDIFSNFYINMVKAGEAYGDIGSVLEQLGQYLQRQQELTDSLKTSLIYPTILLATAVISILILIVFVLPQFEQLFTDLDSVLPPITEIVIDIGAFIRSNSLWIISVLVIAGLVVGHYFSQHHARQRLHEWLVKSSITSGIVQTLETSRFCRTLGTLINNKVSILTAVDICKGLFTNLAYQAVMDNVLSDLKEGNSLANSLDKTRLFPPLAIQMIKIGEQGGELGISLLRVAETFEQKAQTLIKRLISLAGPVVILIIGVIIGTLVLSILLAIQSINTLVI